MLSTVANTSAAAAVIVLALLPRANRLTDILTPF
jgi:hypothetical protein